MTQLREFSREQDRPILFTELGYARAHTAAARPWESRVDGDAARALQERCMRVALDAVQAESTLLGVFLWKWFPEPRPLGRNFQLASPGMREAIAGSWTATTPDPARTTAD